MKIYVSLIFLFVSVFATSTNAFEQTNAEKPTVVIVATGGTIAETNDSNKHGAVPTLSGEELVASVPQLSKIAHIKVVDFSNIDSSQMTPQIWYRLSKKVDKILKDPKVKGVVVTHGTDTMAESAYFLDLTLNSNKPVVFTGAMRNASDLSADGPANLVNAVIQVCSQKAKNWGVTVTLNQYINSAKDVRKTQSTNVQTFKSGDKGYLGYISQGKVFRLNNRLYRLHIPLPKTLPKIAYLNNYTSSDGSYIHYAIKAGAKGIVIDALGAGNVNTKMYQAILYALRKKIPVVISTRVYYGGVNPIYADPGGGATLLQNGAILAGNLTGPKARLLLMLAIPQAKGDFQKIKAYFNNRPISYNYPQNPGLYLQNSKN